MIGQTLGHYRILDKLGAGGMGVVYLAEDTELGRRVALKVLPEAMAGNETRLKRFRREAKTLASLNHPNIVTVYSVEADNGVHFLTMELIKGRTLIDHVPPGGITVGEFFDLAIPLADALAVAHDQGVIHRDLKPTNVMVTETGNVKVLDFGLAKLARDTELDAASPEASTEALTGEGRIVGTMPYMSPEQLQGKPVDARSDIFAVGIMLYQMAAGDFPFKGATSVEVASAILRDQPTTVDRVRSEVPHHLGRIIDVCLEKDPEKRYQSIKDVRNELDRLRAEMATGERGALPMSRSEEDQDKEGLHKAGWWVAAALALVALTVGYGWWSSRDRAPAGAEPVPAVGSAAQTLLDQAHLSELRGDTRENLAQAEERYRRALQLEQENPVIQARLAALLARIQMQYPEQERVVEIHELADAALAVDPSSTRAWIAKGRLALLDGDGPAAEQAARQAIEAAPRDYRGEARLGEALVEQYRIDKSTGKEIGPSTSSP